MTFLQQNWLDACPPFQNLHFSPLFLWMKWGGRLRGDTNPVGCPLLPVSSFGRSSRKLWWWQLTPKIAEDFLHPLWRLARIFFKTTISWDPPLPLLRQANHFFQMGGKTKQSIFSKSRSRKGGTKASSEFGDHRPGEHEKGTVSGTSVLMWLFLDFLADFVGWFRWNIDGGFGGFVRLGDFCLFVFFLGWGCLGSIKIWIFLQCSFFFKESCSQYFTLGKISWFDIWMPSAFASCGKGSFDHDLYNKNS